MYCLRKLYSVFVITFLKTDFHQKVIGKWKNIYLKSEEKIIVFIILLIDANFATFFILLYYNVELILIFASLMFCYYFV